MKTIYTFGNGNAEGRADMKELLGGKGANLAEMNLIGVPVPPGFTITCDVCKIYNEQGREAVVNLIKEDVIKSVHHIESLTGYKFNDPQNPQLVSVRSGAPVSMPGMMDTKWLKRLQRNRVTSVLLGIATAVSCRCTATWCSA